MTKKIIITTDFSSKLKLFNLNKKIVSILKKKHKDIEVKKINPKKIKLDTKTSIYWGTRVNDKIVDFFPNLRWIHFGSVGVDKLSYKKIKEKNIIVTNSKLINTDSIFNLIFLYLLDTTKKFLINKKSSIQNRAKYEKVFLKTQDLHGKKILVLGYGNVAKKINNFSKFFKLNTNFFSRRKNILKKDKKLYIGYKKLIHSFKNYDVVINLLPNNVFNKNFLNQKVFSKLKKNVSLILVSRLETINLIKLKLFLKKNKNSSCYIDTIATKDNSKIIREIRKLSNVFISPHIGGYSHGYWFKQLDLFNTNLSLFKKKKKLINVVKISKHNFS